MNTISYSHENQKQISILDFQKVAIISYVLRALGAAIFGFGMIAWFIWMDIELLHSKS